MITQLLDELQALIANNTVLATLNFGAIGTVLLSVKNFMTKSKTTAEAATKLLNTNITETVKAVENKVTNDIVITNKHIDVLRAQNDSLVTLLTIMIKHARWSGAAVDELSEALGNYKAINEKNVVMIADTLTTKLNKLTDDVKVLKDAPKTEAPVEALEQTEPLVNKLFGDNNA
jgi:hypothetical protein